MKAGAPHTTLREALVDPALLGNVLVGESWDTWRSLLLASMGERLTAGELATFQRVTGRTTAPSSRVEEAAFVIGRRGGKDRAASVLATYLAALVDWSSVLVRGERGLVLCIGPDQRQTKITRDYVEGCFDASPILAGLISNRTADTIELSNRVSIEVRAASFRRLRGVTSLAVIATEAAFWQTDEGSGNPDSEILNAVRPSLATTHGPLIIITAPYARRGEVWDVYRRHYGPQGDPLILVAQGTSWDFNPTLAESVVQRALDRDHAAGAAEYLAQFRTDIESFVSREVVEAAVVPGRYELPPVSGTSYTAFCDPSGGSGDSFTLAVAHGGRDGRGVLDLVREVRPPFSPEQTVETFAGILKSYGVLRIGGDRYAGEWPREQFRKHGITYETSEKPKSDLYRELLPLLNSARVELLDYPRLVAQLCELERRTARGGRDSIDHSPGSRDDVANAVAGVLVLVSGEGSALWRRSELLVDASMPSRVDMVFGVLVCDKSGRAGVAFFSTSSLSRPGSAICLLDCEQALLSPSLLHGVVTRLGELTEMCLARCGAVLFTTSELSEALERLGYQSEIIDRVLDDTMLAMSSAVHVSAQRVRVCADVLAKSYPLTFLQGAVLQNDDDPLRVAFLAGVAVALDTNRNLGRSAA
jgi:hypothetical protein